MNVMTFGVYTEIVSRWLGPTRRVIADGAVFMKSRVDTETGERREIDVPDSLGVFATLESGARVTYRFSNIAYAAAPGTNGIAVYGSNGTLQWEPGDRMRFASVGAELQPLTPDAGTEGEWRVERDFVDSIRTGARVILTNFEDGVRYMQIIEAAHRSRLAGRAVDLSEV